MTTLPAYAYLEERGIPYRRLDFAPDTEKGAAKVAAALGFAAGQMVKTLVFETGAGELALVMLGGDRSAVSGHLKKALGSRNIRLADPELVRQFTGYAVGSIPPFHWQPPGFRSLVDAALMEYAELGVGAGEWGREIVLMPADLAAAAGAAVVNLTDKSRPVAVEVDKGRVCGERAERVVTGFDAAGVAAGGLFPSRGAADGYSVRVAD